MLESVLRALQLPDLRRRMKRVLIAVHDTGDSHTPQNSRKRRTLEFSGFTPKRSTFSRQPFKLSHFRQNCCKTQFNRSLLQLRFDRAATCQPSFEANHV